MEIKILGSGCANCRRLEELTRKAVDNLGIEADILKVTEMMDIASYGVLAVPCLVIDEQLVLSGRVPKLEQLEELISRRA